MSTVAGFSIALLIIFLIAAGFRYMQLIHWSIKLVGFKRTLSDIRGLTRTYMAIGSVLHCSNVFFDEFALDLYHAGLGVSFKKGDEVSYVICSEHALAANDIMTLYNISKRLRGDYAWVMVTDDGRGRVFEVGGKDVDKFALVPVTLAYYHLTKNTVRQETKLRAAYGSTRVDHDCTLDHLNYPNPHLRVRHLSDCKH